MDKMTSKIKDPCISVCQYDENEICLGCRRTKAEAKSWWRMSDDEKAQVLINVEERSTNSSGDYERYV
jgi:hypothetical protein